MFLRTSGAVASLADSGSSFSSASHQDEARVSNCAQPHSSTLVSDGGEIPNADGFDSDAMSDQAAIEMLPPLPKRRNKTKAREPFSVRFVPVVDHGTAMNGGYFKPIERRLTADGVIRVGRIESRNKASLEVEPIIFRSKVVSRLHAEILHKAGKWYVRDIESSSGTFLNNARLSPPNEKSPDCPLSNGDILQFGINFRGGREEAFQCIKVHVELDYVWQHRVSEYNIKSLKKVREEMARNGDTQLMECSICLMSVRPGQPLFISACSHGWHYRCIRPLLVRAYPQFQCPNCRCIYDLEDEDDDDDEDDEETEIKCAAVEQDQKMSDA